MNENPLDGVDLSHIAGGDSSRDDATQGSPPAGESSGAPTSEQRTVPYDRFNEVIRERQMLEGQLAEVRRQMAAITGAQQTRPPEPEDPKLLEVRQDLLKVYPDLKELTRLARIADRLEQMAEQVPQFQQDSEAYWRGVARQATDRVFSEAAKSWGVETLTQSQQRMLHREFAAFVEADPERQHRYSMQDQSLVSDFVRILNDDLLTPVRRRTEATVEQRRERAARVPQGGTSSPAVGSAPPQKPKDADELFSVAWRAYNDRMSAGGQ